MSQYILYALLGFLLFIIDIPWLYVSSDRWSDAIKKIQGSAPRYNMKWAVPTYYALGYLMEDIKSSHSAFWKGFATYAVFDGTNLAIFDKYPIDLAIADSIWGGILFMLAYFARGWLGI